MPDIPDFQYLVELLDDEDSVVSESVRRRLSEFGQTSVRALMAVAARESNPRRREAVETVIESINTELKLNALRSLFDNSGSCVSLFESAYIISSLIDPSVAREPFEERFFRCSSEYMAESSDQRTAVENIRIFNHIFFHRLSFSLYDVDVRLPEYALLNEVIRTRKGNPFAVAYIYLMMGQVAGLPLRVLTFPGGFVPVYVENGKELFYINVYRNGEIFLKDSLTAFMSALGLNIAPEDFKLRDENALVSIYLESLQYIFSNSSDEKKCRAIDRALEIFGTERFLSADLDEEGY